MLSQQARLPLQLQASILLSATLGEAAQNLLNAVLTYSASRELAKNLQCKTDAYYQAKPDDRCVHAHHIVPYADKRYFGAAESRAILAQVGIDLNSAANGVWLDCERHMRMHNTPALAEAYYAKVYATLERVPRNREAVAKALGAIRLSIESRTFPGTF